MSAPTTTAAPTVPALQARVRELEEENRALGAQLVAADQQAGELLRLVVTAQRLGQCADRESLLAAVQEIVISVLGSEDFALLALDDSGHTLWPIAAMGPRGGECGPMAPASPLLAASALAPAGGASDGEALVAHVPLMLGRRVVGALLVFSLLPHRDGLQPFDRAVLEHLAMQLAPLLLSADQRAHWDAQRVGLL